MNQENVVPLAATTVGALFVRKAVETLRLRVSKIVPGTPALSWYKFTSTGGLGVAI
jgi:hypothetical protein